MKISRASLPIQGLLFGSLLQVPLSLAHLPGLFGREFVRIHESPDTIAEVVTASPIPLPSEQDRLLYDELLADAEKTGGAYAAGLTDPLLSLGSYHQMHGDVDEAIATYRRALHLVRVNEGLSSVQQLPILRKLMDICRSVGDYPSLGDVYQYYYRVSGLGDAPATQEQLEESLEYLMWERELYSARTDGRGRVHLWRAYLANERTLESLVPITEQDVDWYIRLSLRQLSHLYLIQGEEPIPVMVSASNEGKGADLYANRQLAFIQLTAISRGRQLLESCIEQTHSSQPVTPAALYLELGDWHQWNDQLGLAGKQYAHVVEILRNAGEEQLLMRWLSEPVELPDEMDSWLGRLDTGSTTGVVVEARYDVTSRGDVRRIEVSVGDDEASGQAGRIKRMLRETHFRPRFSQGLPQPVEQVSRRYMLTNAH